MTSRRLWLVACWGMSVAVGSLPAKEPPAPGTTRAAVIAQYGTPSGTVKVGAREILSYREGRVILVDGLVKQFDSAEELETTSKATGYTGTPAPAPHANASSLPVTRTPGTIPLDTSRGIPSSTVSFIVFTFIIFIRFALGRILREKIRSIFSRQ